MSPNCCENSTTYKTVTLFVPTAQSSPAHWVVPYRDEDDKLADRGVTSAFFCPFCGKALGREHLPFERTALDTKGPAR